MDAYALSTSIVASSSTAIDTTGTNEANEMKFDELLQEYFTACLFSKKKRTQETELSCAKHLTNYFGRKSVKKINGQDVIHYRDSRGVGARRVQRELSVASAACNWAISDLGLDIPNPFRGRLMSKRDRQGLPPARKRSLTRPEVGRLVMASHPLLRDIIVFAINTGMRQTEILDLTWDRVQGDVVYLAPGDQKSNTHGYRALNRAAQAAMEHRHKVYVFSWKGERIQRSLLWRWWSAAVKQSGLEDVKFHDLRRTCGSLMLDAGASMEDVKTQLGHSDIRTTQNNYASDSIERAKEAVNRLDGGSDELRA